MPIYIHDQNQIAAEDDTPLADNTPIAGYSDQSRVVECGSRVLGLIEKHKQDIQARMAHRGKSFRGLLEKELETNSRRLERSRSRDSGAGKSSTMTTSPKNISTSRIQTDITPPINMLNTDSPSRTVRRCKKPKLVVINLNEQPESLEQQTMPDNLAMMSSEEYLSLLPQDTLTTSFSAPIPTIKNKDIRMSTVNRTKKKEISKSLNEGKVSRHNLEECIGETQGDTSVRQNTPERETVPEISSSDDEEVNQNAEISRVHRRTRGPRNVSSTQTTANSTRSSVWRSFGSLIIEGYWEILVIVALIIVIWGLCLMAMDYNKNWKLIRLEQRNKPNLFKYQGPVM